MNLRRTSRGLLLALLPVVASACGTGAAGRDDPGPVDTGSRQHTAAAAPDVVATEPSSTSATDPPARLPEVSVVRAVADIEGRVALIDATGQVGLHEDALLSADGTTVVVVNAGDETTTVRWIDTATSEILTEIELTGELDAVATDPNAEVVGLVDRAGDRSDDAIAPGRETTEIVVADVDGEQFRRRLKGNVVPEAFSDWRLESSNAPGAAFVIEFSPPLHPTHYRVGLLDVATGTIGLPLNLRDKSQSVDQLMAGISRSSVVASDPGLLFTLYRGHHDEGNGNYAFIHTLAFGNGVWCLEVPSVMDLANLPGAVAVTPDGDDLVAVSSNGTIASIAIADIIDFEAMPIFDEAVTVGDSTDHPPTITTAGEHLLVGLGTTLLEVDPATLTALTSATMPIAVDAVASGAAGVVVAGEGRLLLLDERRMMVAASEVPEGLGTVVRIVMG